MQCRSVLTRVDALRTGELPAEEQGLVHEHLQTCPSCDDSLERRRRARDAAEDTASRSPPRSCKDELADSYDRWSRRRVWVAFSDHGLRLVHARLVRRVLRPRYAERYGRCLKPATLPDALRKQVGVGAAKARA